VLAKRGALEAHWVGTKWAAWIGRIEVHKRLTVPTTAFASSAGGTAVKPTHKRSAYRRPTVTEVIGGLVGKSPFSSLVSSAVSFQLVQTTSVSSVHSSGRPNACSRARAMGACHEAFIGLSHEVDTKTQSCEVECDMMELASARYGLAALALTLFAISGTVCAADGLWPKPLSKEEQTSPQRVTAIHECNAWARSIGAERDWQAATFARYGACMLEHGQRFG
jgi:hypothetical protein